MNIETRSTNMAEAGEIFGLHGRDVWVFGGAGWLGGPLVRLLASSGTRVLCVDLKDRARQWVNAEGLSDSVTPDGLDVTDLAASETFVRERLKERGAPDGLVILTTNSSRGNLEELTPERMALTSHASLSAILFLARSVGSAMVAKGRGSIVLTSSMYGLVAPDPGAYLPPMNVNPIDYGVCKAGIVQMTRYLAVYWGRTGVRCNCIAPGPFPHSAIQESDPDFVDRLAAKTPMGRIGQRHEIAGPAVFLLAGASSYMTGQTLLVDGGWTAW